MTEKKTISFGKKTEENKKPLVPASPSTSSSNPLSMILNSGQGQMDRRVIDMQLGIREWLDKRHIHMKTNLNQNQINSVCILMGLSKQFNIEPLKALLMNFLTYMISKNESSANQLVNILQSRGLLDSSELEALSKFTGR